MNQISKAKRVKKNGYFLSLKRDSTRFVIIDLIQGLED